MDELKEFMTLKEVLKETNLSSKEKLKKMAKNNIIKIEKINGIEMIDSSYLDIIKNNNVKLLKVDDSKVVLYPATQKDFNYIKELIIIGAKEGHYDDKIIQNGFLLESTINGLINSSVNISDGGIAQTLISYYDNKKVGFVVLKAMNYGMNEIWYFSLDKKYQNQGIGTKILYHVLKKYETEFPHNKDKPIFTARCHYTSEAMFRVFKKFGFIHTGTTQSSFRFLAFSKDSRFMEDAKKEAAKNNLLD